MIFKSETFTNKAGYRKQRRAICQQIKNYFEINGPLRLPHNVINLQMQGDNGEWFNISDGRYDSETYSTWQGNKRLITKDLYKRSK